MESKLQRPNDFLNMFFVCLWCYRYKREQRNWVDVANKVTYICEVVGKHIEHLKEKRSIVTMNLKEDLESNDEDSE